MESIKISNQMNRIKAKGTFNLLVVDAVTGDVVESYSDNNLVVTLGRTNIAKLLGGDAAGTKIAKIAVGTNGTAPVLSDTTLTGIFSKAIIGATYPDANSVLITWDINAGEANGMTIREFGLLNVGDVLVARKVRTDIVKTSSVRLVGSWKITIN